MHVCLCVCACVCALKVSCPHFLDNCLFICVFSNTGFNKDSHLLENGIHDKDVIIHKMKSQGGLT